MAKKVKMADIAQKLGVSTVTVSKALAGKDGVSEAVREKILTLALEMGYQPKAPATAQEHSGATVGVLISERFLRPNESFYWTMYERVLDKLAARGMYGMIERITLKDEKERTVPMLVQGGRVQAIIVIGSFTLDYLQMLRQLDLPVMQMDNYNPHSGLDTVVSDGYYGMYIMTDYLLQKGHRDIAYVGRVGATSSITDRYFGYCRALQENGIPLREDWVLSDRDDDGNWQFSIPEEMPTAFVCNCDAVAYHLIRMLTERGVQVPADVSVVCFDDYLFSELASPKVTCYGVDVDGMAQTGVDQLCRRWRSPDAEILFQVVTGHLVEKESVKARWES